MHESDEPLNASEDVDVTAEEATPQERTQSSDPLSHLRTQHQVGVKPRRWLLLLGVPLGIGLAMALLLVFVRPTHSSKLTTNRAVQDDDGVVAANVRTLGEPSLPANHTARAARPWAAPQTQTAKTRPISASQKALLARQHAPTQVYLAPPTVGASASGVRQTALAGKGAFSQFANEQSDTASTVTAKRIAHPRFTVAEGELMQATLETAINSDLPGRVRAVLTRPVYAYLGEHALLPAGSRLIGQYTALASNGAASERVFVMWNRIITPDGISIMINSPSADALGRAGAGADAVDGHFIRIFGTASLLSVIGAYASNAGVSNLTQPNSADNYRQAIGQAFQQSAQSILSHNLNIKPTIHVYQGDAINVFVAHDLDLYPVLHAEASS